MTTQTYRPSRFTIVVRHHDDVVVYNSLRGVVTTVRPPHAEAVHALLHNRKALVAGDEEPAVLPTLIERGFLVPADHDELAEAGALREARVHRRDRLELILMPTEACNFRCTYCYEDFTLGRMLSGVRDGVRNLVRRRQAAGVGSLSIAWFGGEPLVAFDVIEELSEFFCAFAADTGVAYDAAMTTNGSLLTEEVAGRCLGLGIRKFQITLDGPRHVHDRSRPLMGGGGTFDDIVANVRALSRRDDRFKVSLRLNFSRDNAGSVPELLEELGEIAARDARFRVLFRAVGRWGGPQDEDVNACAGKEAELVKLGFYQDATERGLVADDVIETLSPKASVCYAANPWSLVIRPNGTVSKCTVALRDPRNMVGRLREDGTLELDDRLMRLWTENDEASDHTCQQCFFRPSCQGAHCPLVRIQDGVRPCPPQKVWIGDNLRTVVELRRTVGASHG